MNYRRNKFTRRYQLLQIRWSRKLMLWAADRYFESVAIPWKSVSISRDKTPLRIAHRMPKKGLFDE